MAKVLMPLGDATEVLDTMYAYYRLPEDGFGVDVASQHRSVSVCHLANISMRLGRKLKWDPHKELFPGNGRANSFLGRKQREPYGASG